MVTKPLLSAKEQYDLIISKLHSVDKKEGGMTYASVKGVIFVVLRNDGVLGIRLSPIDKEAFITRYQGTPFEYDGSTMKGFVAVPENVFMETALISEYLKKSHAYAVLSTLNQEYFGNGQIKYEEKPGLGIYYYKNGQVKAQGEMRHGEMDGEWFFYKKDGRLWQIGFFSNGLKHGDWIRYDEAGEVIYHAKFNFGKLHKKLIVD